MVIIEIKINFLRQIVRKFFLERIDDMRVSVIRVVRYDAIFFMHTMSLFATGRALEKLQVKVLVIKIHCVWGGGDKLNKKIERNQIYFPIRSVTQKVAAVLLICDLWKTEMCGNTRRKKTSQTWKYVMDSQKMDIPP